MSNRLTKGTARVGGLSIDSSGGINFRTGTVGGSRKIKALTFAGTATSEQTLAWSLPDPSIVHDVWVKITTASSAAGTINVGLITTSSGDADGFVRALGTSTTGVYAAGPLVTQATSGSIVTGSRRGVLISSFATGTTDLGSWGYWTAVDYPTTANKMLETVLACTLNSTSGTAGQVFIEYTEV